MPEEDYGKKQLKEYRREWMRTSGLASLLAFMLALLYFIVLMFIGSLGVWDTRGSGLRTAFGVIYTFGLMAGGSIVVAYCSFQHFYRTLAPPGPNHESDSGSGQEQDS